ncbi:ATP-binding protein [Croceitalea sp. P059]|uniref:sensor histidine kinase n=1 Tax=Croceitalea sp. P059 TaxID=3075601 RepID=UPI002883613A|nr:ATP-binding protein [Croceitalea sp. P059]MDT0541034.1 ATP-binding protein [Croceitalea sp. P059]
MVIDINSFSKDNQVLVPIRKTSIIFHALIVLVLAGLATNFFIEYGIGGLNKYALKHLIVFFTVLITAISWKLNWVSTSLMFLILVYINIISSTIYLPFRVEDSTTNFEGYFLRVQMIVFVMGLLLAVFEKPYHQLVVIVYNTIYITSCIILMPEMPLGKFILAFIIISSIGAISYFVFKKVIVMRQDLHEQNALSLKQNLELQELTSFRKEIVQIIAHDLKTPIHQISILAEITKNSKSEVDRNSNLDLLKNSVDKTYTMLEGLLDWAMQTDDTIKSYMHLDIRAVVEDLKEQFSEKLNYKKLIVSNGFSSDFKLFYSKQVFETAMRNLLTNAIKFSPVDEKIEVAATEHVNYYSFSIKNKARAIDITKLEQVNRGEQVESALGTSYEKGSGKGLSIVKQMLAKNNGELHLNALKDGVEAVLKIYKRDVLVETKQAS